MAASASAELMREAIGTQAMYEPPLMLPESKQDGEQQDYQMLKELEDRNDALRCYKTKEEWETLKTQRNEEWETECGTVTQGRSGRKKFKAGLESFDDKTKR